ncbi:MAG TPA: gephyrin-like molybdotransferase Glp [Pyrinomonadaceae bacterium]|jgi:molybdenum cofactor synthesis domain-containing protein|nr:gephyrin-like molybdotransferase Glp [Pyrinomonadaceae bacterium]
MISVTEAILIVKQRTGALPSETVPLSQARGRFLAQDVVADSALPPFDRSQMDGYAVRASDVQNVPARLKIVGESAAGRGWHQKMQTGEAVRIMTGAPVPEGADSVQQVELTREAGTDEVEILETVTLGRSIVKRGAEIKAGQTVLHAGEPITAATMAVLASFGYDKVDVGKQPRVAVLATGSELVAVDRKPGPDQIRDSNNLTIGAYAELAGALVERLPLAGDDTSLLKRQIMEAAERCDVVVTSGGVSVGVYDFTKPALRELGAEFFFERVALRPGKPTVFARLPNGSLFFGLPGNPVSVAVTFNLFARTAILAMQAATDVTLPHSWAVLSHNVKGAGERESYLPATLSTNEEGLLTAEPLRWGGSSDFVGFVGATSLIVIPSHTGVVEAGSRVSIVRLPL